MKERPIIFSAPMVRAILDGRKTQTRRLVKPHVKQYVGGTSVVFPHFLGVASFMSLEGDSQERRFRYGQPGDRLWVKEMWQDFRTEDPKHPVAYRATWRDEQPPETGWRPSIFMPHWASRITLEITHVRVERLQDITEEDAMNEGATPEGWLAEPGYGPVDWFEDLWDSINGPASWDLNPWVWVIQFKRVT